MSLIKFNIRKLRSVRPIYRVFHLFSLIEVLGKLFKKKNVNVYISRFIPLSSKTQFTCPRDWLYFAERFISKHTNVNSNVSYFVFYLFLAIQQKKHLFFFFLLTTLVSHSYALSHTTFITICVVLKKPF